MNSWQNFNFYKETDLKWREDLNPEPLESQVEF